MSIYYGVTLSSRHKEIDLVALKEYGFKIAYITASDGFSVDEMLFEHYENAKKAGFKLGYVHNLDCRKRPQGQAEIFINSLRGLECHTRLALNGLCCGKGNTERCLAFNARAQELSGVYMINMMHVRCAKATVTPLWVLGDENPKPDLNYVALQKWNSPLKNICDEDVAISTFTDDIFIPPVCILKNGSKRLRK